MTWQPAARAEWVALVNSGAVTPIADEAGRPLGRDQLLDEARARAGADGRGADGFGDDEFLEPLDILLGSLEEEAQLTIVGRWMTRRFLLRLLAVRLQVVAYLRHDPGVVDEEIVAPLFVTGLPRTGTTLMHAVLARDPALRAPAGWELLWPLPPPGPSGPQEDARVALADAELRMLAGVVPAMDVIHEYGARMPKECLSAHSFSFRSEEFTARYHVPSYEAWLLGCDMAPAYAYHRLVLQILQRRRGTTRWVLKSPVHLHSLPVVLAEYPDARVVVTHRDPLTVLGSAASLVANLRWVHSDAVEVDEIGRGLANRYAASLLRLVELDGELPASGRLHHVRYEDVVKDVLAELREMYEAFDLPMTTETQQHMEAELAARPQGKHGTHEYAAAKADERFTAYRRRFRV